MDDKQLLGKIVYLTVHTDTYLREINPKFNVPMANRTAKIIKIFDWETEEGKLLLKAREKIGKWGNTFNPKDFKYVLKVYYPDLKIDKNKRQGLTVEEVLPRFYPGTEFTLFEVLPDWVLKDYKKKIIELSVVDNKDIPK